MPTFPKGHPLPYLKLFLEATCVFKQLDTPVSTEDER